MEKAKWVKCPSCSDDWLKLRPCRFLKDGRLQETFLCVDCAEGVRAFGWINDQPEWIIPGATIETRIQKSYLFLPEKYRSRLHYVTTVNCFGKEYTLTSKFGGDRGFNIIIFDGEAKAETKENNSISAWVYLYESVFKKVMSEEEAA